jgi:ABC-type transport system involved in multi-copper enzyme maturation permease subunit
MRHVRILRALAAATIREAIRRHDLYVLLILAVLLLSSGAVFHAVGIQHLDTLLKDLGFTVVNWMSTLLCIAVSVRQLPEELQRRTLYPLLARPISRWHLVLGKYLGAAAMSVVALVALTLLTALILAAFQVRLTGIFWQYLLLRAFALTFLSALAMALSLVLTPPAAFTVSLLLAAGSGTVASALTLLPESFPGAGVALLRALYFAVPHTDLFDLSAKVANNWPPIPAWAMLFLAGYAAAYAAIFLGLGVARFHRQAL